jgi:hypothetical protein
MQDTDNKVDEIMWMAAIVIGVPTGTSVFFLVVSRCMGVLTLTPETLPLPTTPPTTVMVMFALATQGTLWGGI